MAGQIITIKYQEWAGSVIATRTKKFPNYTLFLQWFAFQTEFRPQYFVRICD
jgi:hypothetical protein